MASYMAGWLGCLKYLTTLYGMEYGIWNEWNKKIGKQDAKEHGNETETGI